MALLTPKMSLRLWEQLNDPYSHEQLADNFSKIDFHDHSPGRGNQIPSEGLFDGAVTGAKIAANVLAPYRLVHSAVGTIQNPGLGGPGLYMIGVNTALATGSIAASQFVYVNPADHAITGRNTRFRLRGMTVTNAVAPNSNLTFGLYPIGTLAGGTGVITTTATSVVTDSTALISLPGSGTASQATSLDFALTAGFYYVAINVQSAVATNANVALRAHLEVHNV